MVDAEKGLAWLKHRAPIESERPWAPIESSLPDPELLPSSPPLYARIPTLFKWSVKNPLSALIHLAAWGGTLSTIAFVFQKTCLPTAIAAAAQFSGLWALERRYALYCLATVYQLDKSSTLATVTTDRLVFRRRRCVVLCALLAAIALLSLSKCATRRQFLAASLSFVPVASVLYLFHKDPVEEAALKERACSSHQN